MHVLIIEDKKQMARMLKLTLEEKGHSAVLCFDGRSGLAQAETGYFDVIVLDLMLPQMSGSEIARRLRADGSRIPILVLTARDTIS